ncbi:MAG TPA: hypothetical protein VGN70_04430 [Gammaproteobacteria bacterium]
MSIELDLFVIMAVFNAGVFVGTSLLVIKAVRDHERRLRSLENDNATRKGLEQARLQGIHHAAFE